MTGGVSLRPDGTPGPQECSSDARLVMRALKLQVGDAALVELGQVWTAGPQVVIRYYEAHPPDSEKLAICAVARLSYDQMRKLPESKPGTAILEGSFASAYVVDSFR
ncbi:serine/threonine protein kinase [Pyxidicoccus trucidator]|uniref:serine/threonine protein kinase n=1 Tax=Pyxidicoccus trucidator TaxID=2709662 RepID=UPI001F081895|nr:serine/threonine protein kinase [Pyxidicoccus trucidator]